MITNNLRINQLSDEAYAWYIAYLEATDSRDFEGMAAQMADNISVQLNNDEPVQGKDKVLGGLEAYWQSFKGLEHELLNIYGNDRNFVVEALDHYQRSDGHCVTVRAVACMDRDDNGLIVAIRAYADPSPAMV